MRYWLVNEEQIKLSNIALEIELSLNKNRELKGHKITIKVVLWPFYIYIVALILNDYLRNMLIDISWYLKKVRYHKNVK